MILDTNILNNYMESFTGVDCDIPALAVRDFSECTSIMEASMLAQQEQAENWQLFNQKIARVEASYLRENGVAMYIPRRILRSLSRVGLRCFSVDGLPLWAFFRKVCLPLRTGLPAMQSL